MRFIRRYFWHLAQAALFVGLFTATFINEMDRLKAAYPGANLGDLSNQATFSALSAAVVATMLFVGLCLLIELGLRGWKKNRGIPAPRVTAEDPRRIVSRLSLIEQDARKARLLEDVSSPRKLR